MIWLEDSSDVVPAFIQSQLFVYIGLEDETHKESLDLGKQIHIAQIPPQPTSRNTGVIDMWLHSFHLLHRCHQTITLNKTP